MKKVNSREKGKRAEREWAKWLTNNGIEARRGVQYSGNVDGNGGGEDVVACEYIHHEVKMDESITLETAKLEAAMNQSTRDSMGKTPVVAHRTKNKKWKVTMRLHDVVHMESEDMILITFIAEDWIKWYMETFREEEF